MTVRQPNPIPNGRTPIVYLVMEDLEARMRAGIQTYGTPLQAHNGRKAIEELSGTQITLEKDDSLGN